MTKFQILAIEADRAELRKRAKNRNFVKFLVCQLIQPHCSASDATLDFFYPKIGQFQKAFMEIVKFDKLTGQILLLFNI